MNETPPRWDLTDLYKSPDDPRLADDLTTARTQAEAFARRYRSALASLAPGALAEAIAAYESLLQHLARPGAYASLYFAADASPEAGALLQRIRESVTDAQLPLLFFPIELTALGVKRLDSLRAAPELAPYAYYLTRLRDEAAYRLSEAEESLLAETANTGPRALARLADERLGSLVIELDGRELTLPEATHLQHSPDRSLRERGAEALSAALARESRLMAFLYNNLIQAKAVEDRRRGYASPEAARHLENNLTEETVELVARSVERAYPLVARYYNAKRRALGYETLHHWDRYAPLPTGQEESFPWSEAKETILTAFAAFDPDYAQLARGFFDSPWIDAEPRKGKRSGAFCSYVAPDHHPFLFQTYLGTSADVTTLAHELGHGIHGCLSQKQTYLNFQGTLPLAEVASTFAEQLVFTALAEKASPEMKRNLYARRIEGSLATIFRQIALYRFEQAAHRERAGGEVSAERLGQLWQESVGAMFGDSVQLGQGHASWWSYVSHFFHVPFYVYAYAFGELLALALHARWREQGSAFAAGYLEMLARGGSLSPCDLLAPLGVRLDDPALWQSALESLEGEITVFESLLTERHGPCN